MYVIFYDYDDNKVRDIVMKRLKKLGKHVQWSVFESEEPLWKIETAILEGVERFRVGIFLVDKKGIIKIGTDWEDLGKRVF